MEKSIFNVDVRVTFRRDITPKNFYVSAVNTNQAQTIVENHLRNDPVYEKNMNNLEFQFKIVEEEVNPDLLLT